MQLYNFFASGTSHRLRIALNLKGLDYDYVAVDLRSEEHLGAASKALNPQGLVPALVDGDLILTQSPAIIEWLEERYPTPALLPADANARARVRALAAIVGCDIHPLNNRRVLIYLRQEFGCDEARVNAWCGRWIDEGFRAIERLLSQDRTRAGFCCGNQASLADVYLIPQIASARRFGVDLSPYPEILQVEQHCLALAAFADAAPSLQPDYKV
ncbi:MAG: maleylacetoacetate isomerase [Proteobacteria bacterium]|nr:maleylacetoacetate isomerase [Pseudomonadota bacterium]